ncbi:MAG: hypothetical protein FWF21_14875, partial [Micrococcales bacterium]|nr:hypothetical protein [Micrococcales bacterium]
MVRQRWAVALAAARAVVVPRVVVVLMRVVTVVMVRMVLMPWRVRAAPVKAPRPGTGRAKD